MVKSYSEAGINLEKIKSIQKNINKLIFAGKPDALIGHYAGLVNFADKTLAIHADGVGSKVLVAQQLEKYDTIGIDAVAMNVNDIICIGAKPIAGVDYLALAKEDEFLVNEIFKGLMKGALESGIEIVGGETAILPEIIKGDKRPFDLALTVIGEVQKLITGEAMKPGDVIIGLESSGLHSNGFTLARKILDIEKWGTAMLTPTRIYVNSVLAMLLECKIKGLAHITGGAFSKLTRLHKKHGFLLNNMPKPAPIFRVLYNEIENEQEMHRTFNMGIGMCVIGDKGDEGKILNIAKKSGINSYVIGEIVSSEGVWLGKIRLD